MLAVNPKMRPHLGGGGGPHSITDLTFLQIERHCSTFFLFAVEIKNALVQSIQNPEIELRYKPWTPR